MHAANTTMTKMINSSRMTPPSTAAASTATLSKADARETTTDGLGPLVVGGLFLAGKLLELSAYR